MNQMFDFEIHTNIILNQTEKTPNKSVLKSILILFLLLGILSEIEAQHISPIRNIGKDSTIALVFSDDSTYHVVLKAKKSNNKFNRAHVDLEFNCEINYQLSKLEEICSLKDIRDSVELDTIIIFGPFCSEEVKTKLIALQCDGKENQLHKTNVKYDSLIIKSGLLSNFRNTLEQMHYSILSIDLYRNRILKKSNDIVWGLNGYNSEIPCHNVRTSLVVRFIVERKK